MTISRWAISVCGIARLSPDLRSLAVARTAGFQKHTVYGTPEDLSYMPGGLNCISVNHPLELLEILRSHYKGVFFPFWPQPLSVVPVLSAAMVEIKEGWGFFSLPECKNIGMDVADVRSMALRCNLVITNSSEFSDLVENNGGAIGATTEVVSDLNMSSEQLDRHLAKVQSRSNHSGQNENGPRFTIVTPSYNQGQFIEETILSVLNQSYKNFDYAVVDGGSKDSTLAILKKYEDRLTWISEPDRGYADAVHKGLSKAKGDYMMWLASDDKFHDTEVLAKIAAVIDKTSADVVYGDAFYTDQDGRIISSYRVQDYSPHGLWDWCGICQPATAFRASAYRKCGGLDVKYRCVADHDLWLRLSDLGANFERVGVPFADYRLHSGSITTRAKFLSYSEIFERQFLDGKKVGPSWVRGAVGDMRVAAWDNVRHFFKRKKQDELNHYEVGSARRSRVKNFVKWLIRWDDLLEKRAFQKTVYFMLKMSVRLSGFRLQGSQES